MSVLRNTVLGMFLFIAVIMGTTVFTHDLAVANGVSLPDQMTSLSNNTGLKNSINSMQAAIVSAQTNSGDWFAVAGSLATAGFNAFKILFIDSFGYIADILAGIEHYLKIPTMFIGLATVAITLVIVLEIIQIVMRWNII